VVAQQETGRRMRSKSVPIPSVSGERTYPRGRGRFERWRVGVSLQEAAGYPNVLWTIFRRSSIAPRAVCRYGHCADLITFARFASREVTVATTGDGGDEPLQVMRTYVPTGIHGVHLRIPEAGAIGPAATVTPCARLKEQVSLDTSTPSIPEQCAFDFRRAQIGRGNMFDEAGAAGSPDHGLGRCFGYEDGFDRREPAGKEVSDAHPDQPGHVRRHENLASRQNIWWKVDRATMASSLESRAPLSRPSGLSNCRLAAGGGGEGDQEINPQTSASRSPAGRAVEPQEKGFNAQVSRIRRAEKRDGREEGKEFKKKQKISHPHTIAARQPDQRIRVEGPAAEHEEEKTIKDVVL